METTQTSEGKRRFYLRKERMKQIFREVGIRLTQQRLLIYRELVSRCDHPDVERLYHSIKPRLPKISLFTVYRTMNKLEDADLIHRVVTWKGHARYDGNIEEHAHFLCEKCGKVEDIVMKPECEGMLDHAKSCVKGCEIHRVNILMTGICEECMEKKQEESSC